MKRLLPLALSVLFFVSCGVPPADLAAGGTTTTAAATASPGTSDETATAAETTVFDPENLDNFIIDYNSLSENGKFVYDFYTALDCGEWDTWANMFAPGYDGWSKSQVENLKKGEKAHGIASADEARLVYLEQIEVEEFYRNPDLEKYDGEREYYHVGVYVDYADYNDYNTDGVTYHLITMIVSDSKWQIGAINGYSYDAVIDLEGRYPTYDFINAQWQRSYGEPYVAGMATAKRDAEREAAKHTTTEVTTRAAVIYTNPAPTTVPAKK